MASQSPLESAATLLCVDDDLETLRMRRLVLVSHGYSVSTATSGAEALEIMHSRGGASLVILDYLMPGMNGDELAQHIRREYPAVPLLAVSGVVQLPASLLEQVDAHLTKGEDPEILLSTIASLLLQHRRLRYA